MDQEEQKYCEFCKNDQVPAKNFKLHQLGCQKNNQRMIKEEQQIKIEKQSFDEQLAQQFQQIIDEEKRFQNDRKIAAQEQAICNKKIQDDFWPSNLNGYREEQKVQENDQPRPTNKYNEEEKISFDQRNDFEKKSAQNNYNDQMFVSKNHANDINANDNYNVGITDKDIIQDLIVQLMRDDDTRSVAELLQETRLPQTSASQQLQNHSNINQITNIQNDLIDLDQESQIGLPYIPKPKMKSVLKSQKFERAFLKIAPKFTQVEGTNFQSVNNYETQKNEKPKNSPKNQNCILEEREEIQTIQNKGLLSKEDKNVKSQINCIQNKEKSDQEFFDEIIQKYGNLLLDKDVSKVEEPYDEDKEIEKVMEMAQRILQ